MMKYNIFSLNKNSGFILVSKEVGETPLSVIEKIRQINSRIKDLPMTYAGRLDPMAEGKLLILYGDECRNKDRYTKLDKEYEFEILFGVETDTGDILGIPSLGYFSKNITDKEIKKILKKIRGIKKLPYPIYSSKQVQGKPLFQHVYDGSIDSIEIPEASIRVHKLDFLGMEIAEGQDILSRIIKRILSLKLDPETIKIVGGFREKEIIDRWKALSPNMEDQEYQIAKFRIITSSGTYIRSIAPLVARELDATGLAFSIRRTVIGKRFGKRLGFWLKKY